MENTTVVIFLKYSEEVRQEIAVSVFKCLARTVGQVEW